MDGTLCMSDVCDVQTVKLPIISKSKLHI